MVQADISLSLHQRPSFCHKASRSPFNHLFSVRSWILIPVPQSNASHPMGSSRATAVNREAFPHVERTAINSLLSRSANTVFPSRVIIKIKARCIKIAWAFESYFVHLLLHGKPRKVLSAGLQGRLPFQSCKTHSLGC